VKLIFLGTPAFAAPSLQLLARSGHETAAVITQPDRPSGRGMRLRPSAVKSVALELGLPVLQPDKASSGGFIEEVRLLKPDVAVVVAYGQILSAEFLKIAAHGCINLHPSLLPRHRGPSPIQSAIMAGESATGITTIVLDEGVDSGDILLQRRVDIARSDTAGSLHDKLAETGAELMLETIDALAGGEVTPRPQDESEMTMTRKIGKSESLIDWSKSGEEIFNLTRALDPMPGCRTLVGGEAAKIWRVEPPVKARVEGRIEGRIELDPKHVAGKVMEASGPDLVVMGGDGPVRILELQPAGGRRMSAEQFLRGREIPKGTVLGS
jgi:methionyl-tRNA formyltransferase